MFIYTNYSKEIGGKITTTTNKQKFPHIKKVFIAMKSTHVSAAAVDVAAKYMLEILTEKAKKKKNTNKT